MLCKSLILLTGPTATGKTEIALDLVGHLEKVEIVSVDSRQIYRHMDIGTAKPDTTEQSLAPHRLIDILDPSEAYSAADFRKDALSEMHNIVAQGKIPLLVGGTMLYYKALLEGLSPLPAANPEIRQQIEQQALTLGWDTMHDRLKEVDPVAAPANLDSNCERERSPRPAPARNPSQRASLRREVRPVRPPGSPPPRRYRGPRTLDPWPA